MDHLVNGKVVLEFKLFSLAGSEQGPTSRRSRRTVPCLCRRCVATTGLGSCERVQKWSACCCYEPVLLLLLPDLYFRVNLGDDNNFGSAEA